MIRPHGPAGLKSKTRPTLSLICAATLFLVIVTLSGQTRRANRSVRRVRATCD